MKKFLAFVMAASMALSLAACGGSSASTATSTTTEATSEAAASTSGSKTDVAFVTDVGNIDDQSFNQYTWQGVQDFCSANSLNANYYRPSEDSDAARLEQMDNAVNDGAKSIVVAGYLFGKAIAEAQEKYPDVQFLALDVSAGDLGDKAPTANTALITYKEEQAGYLAGYAAVYDGYKELGFLGGMAVPAVQRYGYGFVQGVDAAAAELKLTDVKVNYAYGNQFFGDADITAAMDTWYAGGTEIVFACGGGIYTSAVDAAKKVEGAKVIGVDVDQAAVIANYAAGEGADAATVEGYKALTVTSAMKGLYPATFDTLTDVIVNGNWEKYSGKIDTLGLVSADDPAANYVQIPMESTQWADGKFTQDDYKTLVKAMFDGTLTVSNDITKAAKDFATVITVDDQGNIK